MALTEADYFGEGVKFLRDPVHRFDIKLSPYEIQIINTRAFQRLRGIKQLGPCEIVWHCATHITPSSKEFTHLRLHVAA